MEINLGACEKSIFEEKVWAINSVKVKGEDIASRIPFHRQMDVSELRSCIKDTLGVPMMCLQITFSEATEKNDLFLYSVSPTP